MSIKNRSPLVPRLIVVMGIAILTAAFLSNGVEDPTIIKLMQLEQRLDDTDNRVLLTEKQIQRILANKYSDEDSTSDSTNQ